MDEGRKAPETYDVVNFLPLSDQLKIIPAAMGGVAVSPLQYCLSAALACLLCTNRTNAGSLTSFFQALSLVSCSFVDFLLNLFYC